MLLIFILFSCTNLFQITFIDDVVFKKCLFFPTLTVHETGLFRFCTHAQYYLRRFHHLRALSEHIFASRLFDVMLFGFWCDADLEKSIPRHSHDNIQFSSFVS